MRLSLLLVPLLLTACPSPVVPKPAPVPEDTEWCTAAEAKLEKLQCKDRTGHPMWVNKLGERFQETCEIAQEEGRIFLNPKCVAEATSCPEAKQCPTI